MNETVKTMIQRRSVRKFEDRPVPEEYLEEILQAGMHAPSGMNRQPVRFLVIGEKALRDRLAALNAAVMGMKNDPFYGASCVIVVAADRRSGTYLYDGALAMGNMLNAAYSLGLGACWIHRAKEVLETPEGIELLKKCGLDENYKGIANLILGFPEGEWPAVKEHNPQAVIRVK